MTHKKKFLINSIFLYAHQKARKHIFTYGVVIAYLLETHELFRKHYLGQVKSSLFIRKTLSTLLQTTEKFVSPIINFLPHKSLLYFSMKSRLIRLNLGENNFKIPEVDPFILLDTVVELIKVLVKNAKNLQYEDIANFYLNKTLRLIIYLKYFKPKE